MNTLPVLQQPSVAKPANFSLVRSLYSTASNPGEAIELATGLWLLRLPLASVLNHINVYVIENDQGWTLVDTGSNTAVCKDALTQAFAAAPFGGRQITEVIATHFHPDHIGLAGWLCTQGAVLKTTRTCWLQSRLLQLDHHVVPGPEELQFVQRAGMQGMELAAFRRRSPSDFAQLVTPIPPSYHRICDGDVLTIGSRQWTVYVGHGHAAEHVTLWSNDGFVITGDQILPGISSNLSVHPSEPEADLVSEWVASCARFANLATNDTVCLPGHNIPFVGIPVRCQQLIDSQSAVLTRLLAHLSRPSTAIDCLEAIYRRQLQSHEKLGMIAEAMGFLNHLYQRGLVKRELAADQSYLWYQSSHQGVNFQVCFDDSKS